MGIERPVELPPGTFTGFMNSNGLVPHQRDLDIAAQPRLSRRERDLHRNAKASPLPAAP